MDKVIVVGAGIAGLGIALVLGRRGQHVIVCERDSAPVPMLIEDMWSSWLRPGVAQAHLGHAFTPRFVALLRDRAPDVLDRLWAAGAMPWDCTAGLPGEERLPEDAELTGLSCRRPILEGILRQAVEAEPTVEVRSGCPVVGLLFEPSTLNAIPHVVGIRTRDGAEITGDAVVIAGGRQLPVRKWLTAIGAQTPSEVADSTGMLWYTRYFRQLCTDGEEQGVPGDLSDQGYMITGIYPAEQHIFTVDLAIPHWDTELRVFHKESAFMAAAASVPAIAPWIVPGRSTPIEAVAPMGRERNILRQFVKDGRPLALGVQVIGDARCQTHNAYAWGAALAFAEAVLLADILTEYPTDPLAQAQVFESRIAAEVADWHRLAIARDQARVRTYRGETPWATTEDGSEGFIQTVVMPAASEDATVFRAVTRQWTQLDPPSALAQNTAVLNRARELAANRQPPMEQPERRGPTREELIEIIGRSLKPKDHTVREAQTTQ